MVGQEEEDQEPQVEVLPQEEQALEVKEPLEALVLIVQQLH